MIQASGAFTHYHIIISLESWYFELNPENRDTKGKSNIFFKKNAVKKQIIECSTSSKHIPSLADGQVVVGTEVAAPLAGTLHFF